MPVKPSREASAHTLSPARRSAAACFTRGRKGMRSGRASMRIVCTTPSSGRPGVVLGHRRLGLEVEVELARILERHDLELPLALAAGQAGALVAVEAPRAQHEDA